MVFIPCLRKRESYLLILRFLVGLVFMLPGFLPAQSDSILLWPEGPPLSKPNELVEKTWTTNVMRVKDVTEPKLYTFLPPAGQRNGSSVVICPGGGYRILAIDHEGYAIARWFNKRGITAFVLKYRLPNEEAMDEKAIVPLLDAQQAIRLVRQNAEEWGLDPFKIGIMGFSAGGHLASTVGTHFQKPVGSVEDTTSVRPDFMILGYPVVSMLETTTHGGSRKALLGSDPPLDLVRRFSNELQVTSETPPTFIVHSTDDQAVPVENSLRLYQALVEHSVPSEMHLYESGGHGYGMAEAEEALSSWMNRLSGWLKGRGLW
jgi:acetyl esterase/lipase